MIHLANLPVLVLSLAVCAGFVALGFKRLDDDEPMQCFAAWAAGAIVGVLAVLSVIANIVAFARAS